MDRDPDHLPVLGYSQGNELVKQIRLPCSQYEQLNLRSFYAHESIDFRGKAGARNRRGKSEGQEHDAAWGSAYKRA